MLKIRWRNWIDCRPTLFYMKTNEQFGVAVTLKKCCQGNWDQLYAHISK